MMLSCYESRSDRLRPCGHNYILPTFTNILHRHCLILFTAFTSIDISLAFIYCNMCVCHRSY